MTVTAGIPRKQLHEMIEAEHSDFVRLAHSLDPRQWSTPSLCGGWSVLDVIIHTAAHTHGHARHTRELQRLESLSNDRIVAALAQPVVVMRSLPTLDGLVQLTELMVHQQDVRRPLSLPRQIPAESIRTVLVFGLSRMGSVVTAGLRRRAKGLRIEASDTAWTNGAHGPLVQGTAESILMALCGRADGLTGLSGDGLDHLATRLPA